MSNDEAPVTPRSTSKPPSREEVNASDNQLTLAVRQIAEYNRQLNAPDGMLAGLREDVASVAKQNAERAAKDDKNWGSIRHEISRVNSGVARVENAQHELQIELRDAVGSLRNEVASLKIRVGILEDELKKTRADASGPAPETPETTKITKRQR